MNQTPAGVQLGCIVAGQCHAPVVYFASMGEYVKIGTSTRLAARMRSFYLTMNDVLLIVPGGRPVEEAFHARFHAYAVGDERRELFLLKGDLRAFLTGSQSTQPVTSGIPGELQPAQGDPRGELVSLREWVDRYAPPGVTRSMLTQDRYRSDKGNLPDGLDFPDWAKIAEDGRKTQLFWSGELSEFNAARRGART